MQLFQKWSSCFLFDSAASAEDLVSLEWKTPLFEY